MHVIINGEPQTVADGATIARLVERLGLNGRRFAVEVNRAIIAREQYAARVLADGDQIEIVHFVGGG